MFSGSNKKGLSVKDIKKGKGERRYHKEEEKEIFDPNGAGRPLGRSENHNVL